LLPALPAPVPEPASGSGATPEVGQEAVAGAGSWHLEAAALLALDSHGRQPPMHADWIVAELRTRAAYFAATLRDWPLDEALQAELSPQHR
jgi:hypothetical protein